MNQSPHQTSAPSDSAAAMLPITGPWITELEVQYAAEAARTAWYGGAGRFCRRFEEAFAASCGRRHAFATPNCTSALHLILAGLGVGPGDEVIVPDATWTASVAPVVYVGAEPVFVDIDPTTWCLSAAAVAAAITPRTRAIIAVDLYGGMPDMTALEALAARRGLALIEDSAEAFGSRFAGRPAGNFGVASAFSFHGTKTLTTGEGGMLLTDDDDLARRVEILRDHGREPKDPRRFYTQEVGFKYRMSDIQAAVGLAQVERGAELVARKREIFHWYQERLAGRADVTLNAEPEGTVNGYWMTTAIFQPASGRDKVSAMARLERDGVSSRPFFYPLSSLPAYSDRPGAKDAIQRNPVSYGLSAFGINLPSALILTRGQVDRACDAVIALLEETAAQAAHARG